MAYNPYDLLVVRIDGVEIHGRPCEFDSQAVDNETMKNEFGGYVKPTHVSTICPGCGQGLVIENICLPDPPFPVIEWACSNCNPDITKPVNAFMNPLDTGRIADHQLDPLLHNPDEQVVVDIRPAWCSEETVADRMSESAEPKKTKKTAKKSSKAKKTKKTEKTKKIEEKAEEKAEEKIEEKVEKDTTKRTPIKGAKVSSDVLQSPSGAKEAASLITEQPAPKIEKAEGLTEEFDDNDLVEDE